MGPLEKNLYTSIEMKEKRVKMIFKECYYIASHYGALNEIKDWCLFTALQTGFYIGKTYGGAEGGESARHGEDVRRRLEGGGSKMKQDAALKHTEGAMGNRSRSGVDTFKFSYIHRDQKLKQAAASATRAPVTRIKDGSGWKYVIEEVLDETEDQVLIK